MSEYLRLWYFASWWWSSIEQLHLKIKNSLLEWFESWVVICNKAPWKAWIYERANREKIPIHYFGKAKTEQELLDLLNSYDLDYLIWLGYNAKIWKTILDAFPNRILNIHPTLLPRHWGKWMVWLAPHLSVLRSWEVVTWPTIHLMDDEYDTWKILDQREIDVPPHIMWRPTVKNAEILQKIVLEKEYKRMPRVLEGIRDGEIDMS